MRVERWSLGILLVAAGCAHPPKWKFWEPEPTREEIAISGESWERIFEVASEVLEEEGSVEESDLAGGVIRTSWSVQPHPFPGEGLRECFEVRLVRDDASGAILIRCIHHLERNQNKKDVLNLDRARWVPARADPSHVRALCWRIAYRLERSRGSARTARASS